MWVSVLKICILSVFERNNVQRWLKYTLFIINTFVFHYIQEFGNKRNNLEGHFNQKKSHSFEYKSPLFTLNSELLLVHFMQRAKDNVNFRFTLSSAHWQFKNNNGTIILLKYFLQWPIKPVLIRMFL